MGISLILAILGIASATLKSDPAIPAEVGNVVTEVEALGAAIVSGLRSGNTLTINPLTILATLSGVIAALRAQPGIPQALLDQIDSLDRAIQAALVADAAAQKNVDYTTLHEEAPTQLPPSA